MNDATRTIEREIARMTATLESAGIRVTGELDGGVVTLIGGVDSAENRVAALDIARATVGRAGARIIDAIETPATLPAKAWDQELATRSPDGATDPMTAANEGEPWFAPTDPVVAATGDRRGLAVLNGFAPTSDDLEAGRAGAVIPDLLIEERVARALADDALTSDLAIVARARDGVVHLRGTVPTLEDADNAEAVASGVGGVRQVKESLRIGTFREQP